MILRSLGAVPGSIRTTGTTAYRPGAPSPVSELPVSGAAGWTRWGMEAYRTQVYPRLFSTRILGIQTELAKQFAGKLQPFYGQACERAKTSGFEDLLHPIGTVMAFGVALPLPKLMAVIEEGGATTFTYTPDERQKWLAGAQIYLWSARRLRHLLNLDSTVGWNEVTTWLVNQTDGGALTTMPATVDAFTGRHPEMTWKIPGYPFNPIEPTPEERTGAGGLRAYFQRGGFLLDKRLAVGGPARDGLWLGYSTPLYVVNGYGLCDGKVAAVTDDIVRGRTWLRAIGVSPNGDFTLRIQLKDLSAIDEAKKKLNEAYNYLREVVCRNRGEIELAINAFTGGPTASPGDKAAAAGTQIALNEMCGKPPAPGPIPEVPGGPFDQQPEKKESKESWFDKATPGQKLGIAAGAVAVGILLLRR